MIELSYVSLFSGIEAFSVAASRVDGVRWNPVFFSEIDPFPCAVLAHHFPTVPNLGDICKIRVDREKGLVSNDNGTTVTLPRHGIDILAGGSPCQDVSVAGKRAGMESGSGTRSSLAFEYARLVRELAPRIILWENVPGVLSSNGGRDFAAFLDSLGELGYSDLAYAVLDAQYVRSEGFPRAVPQRRRRVWVVGVRSVGRAGADFPVAASILSLFPRVCRNPPPRREAGQGFAAPPGYCVEGDDPMVGGAGRRPAVAADATSAGTYAGEDGGNRVGDAGGGCGDNRGEGAGTGGNGHCFDLQAFGKYGDGGGASTLKSRDWKDATDLAVQTTPMSPGAFAPQTARGRTDRTSGSSCAFDDDVATDVATPIDASYYKGQGARQGEERAVAVQGVNCLTPGHPQMHRVYTTEGAYPTIAANENAGQNQQAVPITNSNGEDVMPTLSADEYKMTQAQKDKGGGYVIHELRDVRHGGGSLGVPLGPAGEGHDGGEGE